MSVQQIYEQMASQAATEAALAELAPNPDSAAQLQDDMSSGSRVAIHRLLMWVYAYFTKLQRDLWDRFRAETLELANDGHYGTVRWFVARAKRVQLGHTLVLTEKDAQYAVDDPASRIVTHAAVVELANTVVVKVAKAAGAGLAKLSNEELVAVKDYFAKLRPPVQVAVLTADPDRVRMYGAVVYDGAVPLGTVQAAVNAAVRGYLAALDFGGVIRITDLKAAMLAAYGVVDVRLAEVQVRTTGPWAPVPRIYYTYAGHAAVDASHPLLSTLEWQSGNI